MGKEGRVVLGIDPGTALMGYGIVAERESGLELVAYGALTTPSHTPLPLRLKTLYRGLVDLIERHRPDESAVEELFFSRNVRTAIAVGQARGVALLAAANCGLAVAEYSPQQVKQAIAVYGRARKDQVQEMVRVLLRMDVIPEPDDAADALALAICHLHSARAAEIVHRMTQVQCGAGGDC